MKNLFKIIFLFIISFVVTGCFDDNNMKDINIYTSIYPISYITEELYGDNSTVLSIYPDGVDYNKYTVSNKLLKDYSDCDLFIYNGSVIKERGYAEKIHRKIIDAASGMTYVNDPAELWLDPLNMLMMTQNIKNGFNEYIDEYYLMKDINSNYDKLNLELSELDSEFKEMSDSAANTTIVASSDLFKYLEKYGFTVISLEENENFSEKTVSEAKKLIASGTVQYIFSKDTDTNSDTIKNILTTYPKVTVLKINTLGTLSSTDVQNKETYFSIMLKNIDQFKKEVYN